MMQIIMPAPGMRVVTGCGQLVRVDMVTASGVLVTFKDERLARIVMPWARFKACKPYDGPPVLFRDEVVCMRVRAGDKPVARVAA